MVRHSPRNAQKNEESGPGSKLRRRPQEECNREDPPEGSRDSTGEGPWVRKAVLQLGSGPVLFINSMRTPYCTIFILMIKSTFVCAWTELPPV